MVQINLLPWREKVRKAQKQLFLIRLAAFVGLAIFIILIAYFYLSNLISHQEKRNTYLQSQLNQEQSVLTNLKKKQKEHNVVAAQLSFLLALRERSYQAVRLLDGIARVVPEGVTLTKIVRKDKTVTLYGKAQSNLNVTLFMEKISKLNIFKQPDLTEITTPENNLAGEKYFQLKFEQG